MSASATQGGAGATFMSLADDTIIDGILPLLPLETMWALRHVNRRLLDMTQNYDRFWREVSVLSFPPCEGLLQLRGAHSGLKPGPFYKRLSKRRTFLWGATCDGSLEGFVSSVGHTPTEVSDNLNVFAPGWGVWDCVVSTKQWEFAELSHVRAKRRFPWRKLWEGAAGGNGERKSSSKVGAAAGPPASSTSGGSTGASGSQGDANAAISTARSLAAGEATATTDARADTPSDPPLPIRMGPIMPGSGRSSTWSAADPASAMVPAASRVSKAVDINIGATAAGTEPETVTIPSTDRPIENERIQHYRPRGVYMTEWSTVFLDPSGGLSVYGTIGAWVSHFRAGADQPWSHMPQFPPMSQKMGYAPRQIALPFPVASVAAGKRHLLVMDGKNQVWDVSGPDQATKCLLPSGPSSATQVIAGMGWSGALTTGGDIVVWTQATDINVQVDFPRRRFLLPTSPPAPSPSRAAGGSGGVANLLSGTGSGSHSGRSHIASGGAGSGNGGTGAGEGESMPSGGQAAPQVSLLTIPRKKTVNRKPGLLKIAKLADPKGETFATLPPLPRRKDWGAEWGEEEAAAVLKAYEHLWPDNAVEGDGEEGPSGEVEDKGSGNDGEGAEGSDNRRSVASEDDKEETTSTGGSTATLTSEQAGAHADGGDPLQAANPRPDSTSLATPADPSRPSSERVVSVAAGVDFVVALKANGEVWIALLGAGRYTIVDVGLWEYLPHFSHPAITRISVSERILVVYTPSLPVSVRYVHFPVVTNADSPDGTCTSIYPGLGARLNPWPLPSALVCGRCRAARSQHPRAWWSWVSLCSETIESSESSDSVEASAKSTGCANKKVVKLVGGLEHYAALTTEGEMYTWGRDDAGQLGRGSTVGTQSFGESFGDGIVPDSPKVEFPGVSDAFVVDIFAAERRTGAVVLGDVLGLEGEEGVTTELETKETTET